MTETSVTSQGDDVNDHAKEVEDDEEWEGFDDEDEEVSFQKTRVQETVAGILLLFFFLAGLNLHVLM